MIGYVSMLCIIKYCFRNIATSVIRFFKNMLSDIYSYIIQKYYGKRLFCLLLKGTVEIITGYKIKNINFQYIST